MVINYFQIKDLVKLANKLDQLGLYKEASNIDEILLKESGFMEGVSKKLKQLGLAAGLGLGAAVLYPSETYDHQYVQREIKDLNESDFDEVEVEEGQTIGDIAKGYYTDIDVKTGIDIIIELNKVVFDINIESRKIKPGDKIKVPKIESLKQIRYEKEIGMGLIDNDSIRNPSSEVLNLIKLLEGRNGKIYDTKVRKDDYTVGIGHRLSEEQVANYKAGKAINIYGINIRPGDSITKSQAEEIFNADIEKFKSIIDRCNFSNLNQQQYDALLSFTYNVGYVPGSIRKLILSGQLDKVPEKMMEYNKSGGEVSNGLVKRRMAEVQIWNSGIYSRP